MTSVTSLNFHCGIPSGQYTPAVTIYAGFAMCELCWVGAIMLPGYILVNPSLLAGILMRHEHNTDWDVWSDDFAKMVKEAMVENLLES